MHVVSLGCGGSQGLNHAARAALQEAELIIGAQHHFNEIAALNCNGRMLRIPSPFNELKNILHSNQQRRIAVLASGDALFFGIGSWLINTLGKSALVFHPNISSMQFAFHRTGLPWQDAVVCSVHGRPLSTLRLHIASRQLLGIFTDEKSNPKAVAQLLCDEGFSESTVWIFEALGSSQERVTCSSAVMVSKSTELFHPLAVCIVECKGHNKKLTSFPGIPDECFSTGADPGKGMISKREVRLAILSLLQPSPHEVAWDIGAGCGSVSIEWARANHSGKIYAIEHHSERFEYLLINNDRFGTGVSVMSIQGSAPECCRTLPQPDAIFVGGSDGKLTELLNYAWQQLNAGGKLVVSAVTEDSQKIVKDFAGHYACCEGELVEVQVNKTADLTHFAALRELKPVLLLKLVKPKGGL